MPTIQQALDRIWSDELLRRRLLSDPRPILKEFGLNIPDTISVQIHENTTTVVNAVLPMKPAARVSLSDADPVQRVIERAWNEPAFKSRLLANPNDAAREMGVKIPAGVSLEIWENSPAVEHMVLPLDPKQSELSDMELEAVAGGSSSKGASPAPGISCGAMGVAAEQVTSTGIMYISSGPNSSTFSGPGAAAKG